MDNTPPTATIDAIVKVPVTTPAQSAIVCVGGNEQNDVTCTGKIFVRQTLQIQGTVIDPHLNTSSPSIDVTMNDGGTTTIPLVVTTACDTTECTVTANFNTINGTKDGPNQITLSASDSVGNMGSANKLVMVDNTSPVIGSLVMDKAEYVVPEDITVTASGVADNLPSPPNVLGALDSILPEASGVAGVGAKVTTTAGTQPASGTGDFLSDYNALDAKGSGIFSEPPKFLADAAGSITATAKAKDNVGNLSTSATTNAVGLDPTNLICQEASVTSGLSATLFLGTLVNTTLNAAVAGEAVLVELFNSSDALVYSDSVVTDSEGKVYVTNTFNLAHGTYEVKLTYAGSSLLFLAGSACESNPGLLVRSLTNGGGHVYLGIDPETGRSYKGTFGFYLDATSGFNGGSGLLNNPVYPVTYTGSMNYVDHSTKEHYQALTVGYVQLPDTKTVKFGGEGRTKTPGSPWYGTTYELTVQDNGEPGSQRAITASGASHDPDTFHLTAGGYETLYPNLQGGNIQVRE